MNVLITGANGLVGQKLVLHLASRKDLTVIATGRGESRIPGYMGRYQSTDLTSQAEVNQLFELHRPHAVIHTAAMTNVDQCELNQAACWENNVVAVKNLVNACTSVGSSLIHFSTDFIFDGENGPYVETDTPKPISFYGESKLAAEQIIQASSISWAIGRTVLVYGIAADMSRTNIVLWVKKSLEDGKTIQVVNDQWRTPSLAEDLVLGAELLLDRKATGIFNLSSDEMMTPYELALKVADYFGLDHTLIQKADKTMFTQPAKRPPKTGFIIEKARKELGFNPRNFSEGLEIVAHQIAEQSKRQ